MVGVTTTDLAMLEDRVEQLERIYGKNASEKEAVKILEELNTKVTIIHFVNICKICKICKIDITGVCLP